MPKKKTCHSQAVQEKEPINAVHESYGTVLLVAKVYVAADKYDVPAIKTVSKSIYEQAVSSEWNTHAFMLSLEIIYENAMGADRLRKDVAVQAAAKNIT